LVTGQIPSAAAALLGSAKVGAEHKSSDGKSASVDLSIAGQSFPVPVVMESGAWKVCPDPSTLGSLGGGLPSGIPSGIPTSIPSGIPTFPSELPTGIPTVPSISIPSIPGVSGIPSIPNISNLCGFAGDPESAATAYVSLAEVGQTSEAQGCVFQNSVPESVTASLAAKDTSGYYAPAGSSGGKYEFDSLQGSHHLEVTMTKESDGMYWVTKVESS
jgi:hypothetical protein